MNLPWTSIVSLFFLSTVACQLCRYEKFTPDPFGCITMNESCGVGNTRLKYEDKAMIVKLLNQYRNEIAAGRVSPTFRPWTRVMPPSSNMREVEWDDELAYVARMHAQTCNRKHDREECRKVDRFDVVGQTIYVGKKVGYPKLWEKMIKTLRYTSYSDHNQLIWAETFKIGCGKVETEEKQVFVVCNYAPGSRYGVPPFQPGLRCSNCPSRTCCGKYCSYGTEYNSPHYALCKLEKCKYKELHPDHVGCKLRNTSCNIVDGEMTKEEKDMMLKLHNDYRQHIAGGDSYARTKYLSSATNMRELEWNDELAYLAQRHAETCNSDLDCDDCRKVDRHGYVAQRVYVSSPSDDESSSFDFTSEAAKMFNYDEMDERPDKPDVEVLRYAHTWKLGCGRAVYEEDEKTKVIIVCYFAPSSKLIAQRRYIHLYNQGMACTECPTATCCDKDCNTFGVRAEYKGLCKSNIVNTPGFNIDPRNCRYRKFTLDHAICQPRNLTCNILNNYISNDDIKVILNLYNDRREKLAMGRDSVFKMPSASNMREMEWDEELALIAQRHAETCIDRYNCYLCRKSERFKVHQMMYSSKSQKFPEVWEEMFKDFLKDEDHFFVSIWSNTWRMGCGKVEFEDRSHKKTMIVCNYGPDQLSEFKSGELNPYRFGWACTECPSRTCCGASCNQFGVQSNHEGLCKSIPDLSWDSGEDFEVMCRFTIPAEPSLRTDHSGDLQCRVSIFEKSSKKDLTDADLDFVRCGFSSNETSNTVESMTCRVGSAGEMESPELLAHAVLDDFEFIKCAFSTTEDSAGSDFVKCGVTRDAELPAVPDSIGSEFLTCDMSEESPTSDTESFKGFNPVKCHPGE